ncbi:hypothetical protein [Bianquea renquensis]|uniref:Uncharacterized protein n=1 Tax=Bianquea renquensis TaxID=2763661 RepID=A0A926DRL5_9FIRM|nr:hypothetical protein [Bianquea renquensis]MBC8542527.1 hypothetical protein [Bianquea renquensis]
MSRTDNFISTSASQNLKPLRYPDCIYLTEHCRCGILRVSECIGERCSFCQSRLEHRESNARWHQHMNLLSEEKQARIAAVYYGGRMPWKVQRGKEDGACFK